jgi:chromosomal replication initiator protein
MIENIDKFWREVGNYLRNKLGDTAFDTWISPLQLKQLSDDAFLLEAPDTFFRDWVDKHYRPLIQEAMLLIYGKDVTLAIEANPRLKDSAVKPTLEKVKTSLQELPDSLVLNPRYTFDNFVIGTSNRHAHAYSLAVADSPAKAYNPLFVYGGVGLGKTHLIQAICQHIKSKNKHMRIYYIASERFTNELIDAIQHHSTAAFRQKYRNVDVLVIDDIHFIAGKESTQEEFFHTFNTLHDAHKQIIISSDRPPKEIANLQDRLVSRFSWGLTTDIQPPDLETRVAILKKKLEREPIHVPDEVIFFIAQLIKTNIRELEGALIRVIAYALLEEKAITLDLVKEVLKDLLKETRRAVTIDFIQRCVAEEFSLTLQDLKASRRHKNIVLPRQIAMYLSRNLTDLSLPEIGGFFGGKDHTTVLHAYNKIKDEVLKKPEVKEKVNRILKIIQQ